MAKDKFTIELFDKICAEIATSNKGLNHICKNYDVSSRSFYTWIKGDEQLLHSYTRAREEQADFLADEIVSIADDSTNDTKVIMKGDIPTEVENTEWVNRSKLRVEARKWVAAKLKPKKYGDKLDIDATVNKVTITFKDAE